MQLSRPSIRALLFPLIIASTAYLSHYLAVLVATPTSPPPSSHPPPLRPPPAPGSTSSASTPTTTTTAMSWFQKTFALPARARGSYLVTDAVVRELPEIAGYRVGLLHLFVQHTSCALALNENWDDDVRADMSDALDRIVPEDAGRGARALYRHSAEGSDDMPAHVKSALIGASISIPIKDGKLVGFPLLTDHIMRAGQTKYEPYTGNWNMARYLVSRVQDIKAPEEDRGDNTGREDIGGAKNGEQSIRRNGYDVFMRREMQPKYRPFMQLPNSSQPE